MFYYPQQEEHDPLLVGFGQGTPMNQVFGSLQFHSTPAPFVPVYDHQMMDDATRTAILNKIRKSMLYSKVVPIVLVVLYGIIGASFAISAFATKSDVLFDMAPIFVGAGVISLLLVLLIRYLGRHQAREIEQLITSPQIVASWVYLPNAEFNKFRKHEFGFRSKFMVWAYVMSIIFVVVGGIAFGIGRVFPIDTSFVYSILIYFVPYAAASVAILIPCALISLYRVHESLKPWKHSVVLFSNGYIYHYGRLVQLKGKNSVYAIAVNKGEVTHECIEGQTLSMLKWGNHHKIPNIYVPESLRPMVEMYLYQFQQPAPPVYSA